MKILGVCGSLQAQSSNLSLLHRAAELLPEGARLEIFDGVRELPLFNLDIEGGGAGAPDSVRRWREALTACDAVLIASPEYGAGIPGGLKNALDWVFGSGELQGKTVAVTAAAPAPGRGQRGLDAVCATLEAMKARILGGEPIERGPDADAMLEALLEMLVATRKPG